MSTLSPAGGRRLRAGHRRGRRPFAALVRAGVGPGRHSWPRRAGLLPRLLARGQRRAGRGGRPRRPWPTPRSRPCPAGRPAGQGRPATPALPAGLGAGGADRRGHAAGRGPARRGCPARRAWRPASTAGSSSRSCRPRPCPPRTVPASPARAAAGAAVIGAWDFARDQDTDRVTDASGGERHGLLVNRPARAVTGVAWRQRRSRLDPGAGAVRRDPLPRRRPGRLPVAGGRRGDAAARPADRRVRESRSRSRAARPTSSR